MFVAQRFSASTSQAQPSSLLKEEANRPDQSPATGLFITMQELKQRDKDGDTLSDYDEIMIHRTAWDKSDTDEDGYTDAEEVHSGHDPLDRLAVANAKKPLSGFGELMVTIVEKKCELNLVAGDTIRLRGNGLQNNSEALVTMITADTEITGDRPDYHLCIAIADSAGAIDVAVEVPQDFPVGFSSAMHKIDTLGTGTGFQALGTAPNSAAILLLGNTFPTPPMVVAQSCLSEQELQKQQASFNEAAREIETGYANERKQKILEQLTAANFTAHKVTTTPPGYTIRPFDFYDCEFESSFHNECRKNKNLFEVSAIIERKGEDLDWATITQFPIASPSSFPECPGMFGSALFKLKCAPLQKTKGGIQLYTQVYPGDLSYTPDIILRKGNTGMHIDYRGQESQPFPGEQLDELMTMIDSLQPITPADFVNQLPY